MINTPIYFMYYIYVKDRYLNLDHFYDSRSASCNTGSNGSEAFEASFVSLNNESRIPRAFLILVQDCRENADRICEVRYSFS